MVVAHDRGDQAALTKSGELGGLCGTVEGNDRRDRAECLDLVHDRVAAVGGHEERRGKEAVGLAHSLGTDVGIRATGRDRCRTHEGAHLGVDVGSGQRTGERAHLDPLDARIADDDPSQRFGHSGDDVVHERARHQCPADRRALLSGLGGHLTRDRLDEQSELVGVRRGLGPEDRRVERVCLGIELDTALGDSRVAAEHGSCLRRAGQRDVVADAEVVDHVTGRAGEELEGALREDPGLDDLVRHDLGEVHRGRRRLDDDRQPGQQARRHLLEHAPDGEVVCVDREHHPTVRGVHGLTHEPGMSEQRHGVPLAEDGVVGQLLEADRGIHREHVEPALDIDPGIGQGRPGGGVVRVDLLGPLAEVCGELLEQQRALVEGQRPQRGAAACASRPHRSLDVSPRRADHGDDGTRRRVDDRPPLVVGGEPLTCDVTLNLVCHCLPNMSVPS